MSGFSRKNLFLASYKTSYVSGKKLFFTIDVVKVIMKTRYSFWFILYDIDGFVWSGNKYVFVVCNLT